MLASRGSAFLQLVHRIDQCLTVCVTPGGPCSLQLSSNVNAFILWRYVHLACSNAARTWPPLVPDRGIGGRDKLLWLEAEPHLDWSSTFGNIYNLKQLAHNYVLAGQINLSNQPGQSEASNVKIIWHCSVSATALTVERR